MFELFVLPFALFSFFIHYAGWLLALADSNKAQTSLKCALECGPHKLIKCRREESESLKLWQTPLEDQDLN